MGAPKGNQFWKKRAKHGRNKIFSSPEVFFQSALEYFEEVDNNPILKHDVIRGGQNAGESIYTKLQRPYSIQGLCIFLGIAYKTFLEYETSESHKDFGEVFTQVREIIEANQRDGATVNIFNSNIIARMLGLTDKKDLSNTDGSLKSEFNIIVPDKETGEIVDKLAKKLKNS